MQCERMRTGKAMDEPSLGMHRRVQVLRIAGLQRINPLRTEYIRLQAPDAR